MFIFAHTINKQMEQMTKKNCQNRIRVVLADKQITNRWLADQMGVTDMTVSRWKTNKIQPSMSQFVEIARLLQVDIKDLLEVDFNKNGVFSTNNN
ncbi:DNA-binding helix-turn-helix protein [Prevotella corporis]|uniref:DNA-binding helix-turn-helix protein n=2 Tax=Prevotella corporis TaxID=28128 RepID=A0A133PXP3_9BACT|nr:DNA-binding helix-turn-helix protein [Prevotella corporis]